MLDLVSGISAGYEVAKGGNLKEVENSQVRITYMS